MIIDILYKEHRNLEKLLLVLERELSIFDRGERPDYEVIWAVISYFQVYPEAYHHPQEDLVLRKLKIRDPAAAAKVGDLEAEHRCCGERLRKVTQAVESILMDRELPRGAVDSIIRNFIESERRHIFMEESDFFPAAVKALKPEDWAEIASSQLAGRKDPLFSDVVEERFNSVRQHILALEEEAEAKRA